MRSFPGVRPLLLVSLAALAACSGGLLDGGSRAGTDACDAGPCTVPDSGGNDGAVIEDPITKDPIWGCLGNVPPPAVSDPNTPLEHSRRFVGVLHAPLEGLSVKVCEEYDPACSQPVAGTPRLTDPNGKVDLTLHRGFRGFLDVASPASDPIAALIHLVPIPDEDVAATDRTVTWPTLLTKSDLELMMASPGRPLLPDHGHLFVRTLDCQQEPAERVFLRLEPISAKTVTFYLDSTGNPSITQGMTSAKGVGGAINVPAGSIAVTFSRETGEPIGEQNVIIRPGTITYVSLVPTP
ncbi:MAG TPA: hypothetical protein VM925_21880 [Labilithrix sp.]|jgi:hypothetical protein|nr:hypothetical protein [Labilithrix sp.]